jgi:hypothetical protein
MPRTTQEPIQEITIPIDGNSLMRFSYDYDPSNPQLGDRVMLSPTDCPRELWSENKFGNEYEIVSIVSDQSVVSNGTVRIRSPFDSGITSFAINVEWLEPAPIDIEPGTRVLFHDLRTMGGMYRDRDNINGLMVDVVANQWRQPITIHGDVGEAWSGRYFFVCQDGEQSPNSWHRDWMYITSNPPRESASGTDPIPRSGDTIIITTGDRKGVKAFVRRVARTWGVPNTHVVYLDKASKTHYPLDCRVCKRHGIVFENQ